MDCLRRGAPLVIKESTQSLQRPYNFEYFVHALKGQKIKVVHILHPEREEITDAYEFFERISTGAHHDEVALWKIKVLWAGAFFIPTILFFSFTFDQVSVF